MLPHVLEVVITADSSGASTPDPLPAALDFSSTLVGESTVVANLPTLDFAELDEVENLVQRRPETTADVAHVGEAQRALVEVGEALFDATLGTWGQWPSLLQQARGRGERVRIQLRSSSPLVASQPWELLHSSQHGGYLALTPGVSIIRNPHRLAPPPAIEATRPLRVLMCGSTPVDLPRIDVLTEFQQLASVFTGLGNQVEGYYLNADTRVCTFDQLAHVLATQGPWHVVHFSGHGGFDPSVGGLLAFTTDDGHFDSIPAAQFARAVSAHPSARLVVLNACRGAMGAGRQLNESVAGALVHNGVPSCISMQFEVSDGAALPFARAFYLQLLTGGDVELSLAAAREAVAQISLLPGDVIGGALRSAEWATPVLHLEAADARLFPAGDGDQGETIPDGAPPPIFHQQPVKATLGGSVEEVDRMHWRLSYETELNPAQVLERLDSALRATMDVRRLTRQSDRIEASVGGVFPGVWAATENVTVVVAPAGDRTLVTVDSQPRHTTLLDSGRNRGAIERLATHLGIEVTFPRA